MHTETLLDEYCGGECATCVKARRVVSAVVTGTLNHMVGWTEEGDLDAAGSAAARFLRLIAETPRSTRELVGAGNVFRLANDVTAALSKIEEGDATAASTAFRVSLMNWYETYPAYSV
jgi:hypothetical protein